MGRVKALGLGVVVALVFLSIQAVVTVFVTVKILAENSTLLMQARSEGIDEVVAYAEARLMETDVLMTISIAASLIAILGFGWWYYYRFVRGGTASIHPFRTDGGALVAKRALYSIAMAASLQMLMQGVLSIVMAIWPEGMNSYLELMDGLDIDKSALALAYTMTVAPIAEELVFRGVLFQTVKKHSDYLTANLVQAALFGIVHMNPVQGIYAFALGLFIGMVAEKTKGIGYCIWIHILFNSASVALVRLLPEDLHGLAFAAAILVSIPIFILGTRGFLGRGVNVVSD